MGFPLVLIWSILKRHSFFKLCEASINCIFLDINKTHNLSFTILGSEIYQLVDFQFHT